MEEQNAIKPLDEIKQYKELGTVEECRAAVEKQQPERPIQIGAGEGWKCPRCGENLYWKEKYYCNCGQRLDW